MFVTYVHADNDKVLLIYLLLWYRCLSDERHFDLGNNIGFHIIGCT